MRRSRGLNLVVLGGLRVLGVLRVHVREVLKVAAVGAL